MMEERLIWTWATTSDIWMSRYLGIITSLRERYTEKLLNEKCVSKLYISAVLSDIPCTSAERRLPREDRPSEAQPDAFMIK